MYLFIYLFFFQREGLEGLSLLLKGLACLEFFMWLQVKNIFNLELCASDGLLTHAVFLSHLVKGPLIIMTYFCVHCLL